MNNRSEAVEEVVVHQQSPRPVTLESPDDVLAGLSAPRKHLPCRLLYDARGAALFEQICTLDEYYLTRSELGLLDVHLPAIAAAVGPRARVIEPGSGAGQKTRMLLTALERPVGYVPIDVSHAQLQENAQALRREFADLDVQPVCGDYTRNLELPLPAQAPGRTLVFFPGSTIGNFEPDAAGRFLARLVARLRHHGDGRPAGAKPAMLLLGADANGNRDALLAAYDDRDGVTAAFNLNVLAHLNHSHDATFDLGTFEHRAVWDAARSRVEMHLVSLWRQTVRVAGEDIQFERGEPIVTEHCYKHSPAVLESLLASAGWHVDHVWVDPARRMRLWLASAT
jgi:dimethylhistidine N-methyltransferase